jgi:hypothetical protein
MFVEWWRLPASMPPGFHVFMPGNEGLPVTIMPSLQSKSFQFGVQRKPKTFPFVRDAERPCSKVVSGISDLSSRFQGGV